MVDFTNAQEEFNIYGGSEKKKTIFYNGKKYLVKFPDPIREKNNNLSYINNAFSEFIGSNIFKMVGFKTQEVILGTFTYNNKEKIVCACEDFTTDSDTLYEFENLALSVNPDKKIGTEITDIIETIEKSHKFINPNILKESFWDMFIVDALIGNTDRHNGNWGFLFHKENKTFSFAPIYDCGSCLNPLLDDADMSKSDIKNLAINTYSCLKHNDKKVLPLEYIKSGQNSQCTKALIRVFPKINLNNICDFIDSVEVFSDIRKNFYKSILTIRFDILKKIYEKNVKNDEV